MTLSATERRRARERVPRPAGRFGLVLFDVDGVLLDSLAPHLEICADLAGEYGLDVRIPGEDEFKGRVRRGVRISPMVDFFLAVGFPPAFAEKADQRYRETFMARYAPRPYGGVDEMLQALHTGDVALGIVTANVIANVSAALGSSMTHFREDLIFAKDTSTHSKAGAINDAVLRMEISKERTLYVGDQPADWNASREAGVKFLAAAYGWGFLGVETDFPSVRHVPEIASFVLG